MYIYIYYIKIIIIINIELFVDFSSIYVEDFVVEILNNYIAYSEPVNMHTSVCACECLCTILCVIYSGMIIWKLFL